MAMTDAHMRELSAEELAELHAFAELFRGLWKERLSGYWERGKPVPGYPLLYGLRNSHGPSWLASFHLPKESTK